MSEPNASIARAELPALSPPTRQPPPLPLSQEAMEAMPYPFAIHACDGLSVGANTLLEQLFRVPTAALIGRFNLLTDPASQDTGVQDRFRAAVAGQRVQAPRVFYSFSSLDTAAPTPAGCWVEITFLPFRDATGQVTHVGMMFQEVAERIEAEQYAARLAALVENAYDAMGTIDLQGRITYCNPAYLALTGYGEQLIGEPITTIFADDGNAVMGAVSQVVAQGHWRGHLTARRADGSSFVSEVSAFALRDRAGQMTGMAAIVRDLTAQQAQEQRLRMFEALVENVAVGMSFTDLEGNYTYANAALRATYGYGEDLIGKAIPETLAPEERAIVGPNIASLFATGRMEIETVFLCRDGSTRPAAVSALLIPGASGAPVALAAIIRDLTEERARAQELRMAKFSLDHLPDNIHWVDSSSKIVYVNDTGRTLLGYTNDELLGLSIGAIDPVVPVQKGWEQLWRELTARGTLAFEGVHQRKDGSTFPVDVAVSYLEFEGRAFASVIARDISEQKRVEEERAMFQQQVIDAQQAALRELSTPLIPIAEGVVAMPLIGSIDSSRAQLVIETLLTGTAALRASTTIIDITGVPVVDTQVANALLRAAQAVKLLGARVILTGIRPEVAQTLVGLGVDLSGISTRSTLQSGIAEALGQRSAPSASRG